MDFVNRFEKVYGEMGENALGDHVNEGECERIGEMHGFEDVLVEEDCGSVGKKPADNIKDDDITGLDSLGNGRLWRAEVDGALHLNRGHGGH